MYLPCDIRELAELTLEGRGRTIASLSQFRSEKDHRTTLLVLSSRLEYHPEYRNQLVKMVLMDGSCNTEDAECVKQLRVLTKGPFTLGMEL